MDQSSYDEQSVSIATQLWIAYLSFSSAIWALESTNKIKQLKSQKFDWVFKKRTWDNLENIMNNYTWTSPENS